MKHNIIKNKREYSLDLLRVISMLMIITLHYCTFGYKIIEAGSIGNNTPILWIIYAFCYGAVNLYVLISGYFLCESKFKWKKVIKLIVEVLFYSLIIGGIFYFFDLYKFESIKDYLNIFFPVLSKAYWFISIYLIMYIFSPYLNKLINSLKEKEYRTLIIIGVVFILLNNIIVGTNLIDGTHGYGILWFIYLYLVGAYIHKYGAPKINNWYYFILYVVFSFLTYFLRYIAINYLEVYKYFKDSTSYIYINNSFTVFAASVCLFIFFKNLKIKPIMPKIIGNISVATFGVYLIHDNTFIRSILYKDILKVYTFASTPFLEKSLAMIGSVLAVFTICTIIDLIRKFIFDKIGL